MSIARDSFLANSYPAGPFTCIFSKTSPESPLCWLWLNTGSCMGPQTKIGKHALRHRQLLQVSVLSARGIYIGSKTCVIVFLGLRSESVGTI